jgi:hypothetical protein
MNWHADHWIAETNKIESKLDTIEILLMGSNYEALSKTTKNGEESNEARQPRQLWD